jgi:hypothetical protein
MRSIESRASVMMLPPVFYQWTPHSLDMGFVVPRGL